MDDSMMTPIAQFPLSFSIPRELKQSIQPRHNQSKAQWSVHQKQEANIVSHRSRECNEEFPQSLDQATYSNAHAPSPDNNCFRVARRMYHAGVGDAAASLQANQALALIVCQVQGFVDRLHHLVVSTETIPPPPSDNAGLPEEPDLRERLLGLLWLLSMFVEMRVARI